MIRVPLVEVVHVELAMHSLGNSVVVYALKCGHKDERPNRRIPPKRTRCYACALAQVVKSKEPRR